MVFPEKDAGGSSPDLHGLRKSLPPLHAPIPFGQVILSFQFCATSTLHCECEVEASPKQPPQGPGCTCAYRRGLSVEGKAARVPMGAWGLEEASLLVGLASLKICYLFYYL